MDQKNKLPDQTQPIGNSKLKKYYFLNMEKGMQKPACLFLRQELVLQFISIVFSRIGLNHVDSICIIVAKVGELIDAA